MKKYWIPIIIVLAFGLGRFTVPQADPVTVTEYEDLEYPFEPVNDLLDYSYDSDRNRLVVDKTGLKDLDYGDSMQPTIWAGNVYLTHHYSGQDLEPGMIVGVYRPEYDKVWVHRIEDMGREGDGKIWTQGDNNEDTKELVKKSNIRYIVTGVLYTDKDIDDNPNNYTNTWKSRDSQ